MVFIMAQLSEDNSITELSIVTKVRCDTLLSCGWYLLGSHKVGYTMSKALRKYTYEDNNGQLQLKDI